MNPLLSGPLRPSHANLAFSVASVKQFVLLKTLEYFTETFAKSQDL